MTEPAENVAVAERFYALWAEAGIEGLRPLLHRDVEWRPHPQAPEPGPFRGPDEVIRIAASYTRGFGRYRPIPHEILPGAAPDEVLGLATYTTVGREGGQEFTMPIGHLLTIREGKVAGFEEIPDQLEALAAAGVDPGPDAPTRIGGIVLTLLTALDEGDVDLATAMIARGAVIDAPCGPAEWVGRRIDEPEILAQGDEALLLATLAPGEGADAAAPRRVAVTIEADFMGLIRRLAVSTDVDAARRDFEAGRRPGPG